MTITNLDEKPKSDLLPDRYYTPQTHIPIDSKKTTTSIYEATPPPESVVFKNKARVSNESCCLACLIACFLCCAVKGEDQETS